MEPVSEQCTPSFGLPSEIDPTCTESDFLNRLYFRVVCKTEFLESARRVLQTVSEDCRALDGYNEGLDVTCAVNELGRYCAEDDLFPQYSTATDNCRNTSMCDPLCIEILNTITCCFIDQYNQTEDIQTEWLSYEFWQQCGLTSPGFCETRFDESTSRISDVANPTYSSLPNTNPTSGADPSCSAVPIFLLFSVALGNIF